MWQIESVRLRIARLIDATSLTWFDGKKYKKFNPKSDQQMIER